MTWCLKPRMPGIYEVYYLPYATEPTQFSYGKGYTPPSNAADAGWLYAHHLTPEGIATEACKSLREASVVNYYIEGLGWLVKNIGIDKAKMLGYWDDRCPVRTDNADVLATAYVRKEKVLISLASWAPQATKVRLKIDWAALGIDPAKAVLRSPAVRGFQEVAEFAPDAAIQVEQLKGWLLVLEAAKE